MTVRGSVLYHWRLLTLLTAALGACASIPPQQPLAATDLAVAECRRAFDRFEHDVAAAGISDAQAARIADFPYLRVDRFLASWRNEVQQPAAFDAWLDRLARLDDDARQVEMANLPTAAPQLDARLRDCAQRLRVDDVADAAKRDALRQRAVKHDDYSTTQRALGAYALSSLAFARGIEKMQTEMRELYAQGTQRMNDPSRIEYAPTQGSSLTASETAQILQSSAQNALRIPEPSGLDRERLFAAFAPRIHVITRSDADRIGAPVWHANRVTIDTTNPVVYRHVSHTRLGDDVLLQLNYVFWFPARPKTGRFDLLGGELDGLIWRVTLGRDGRVLIYDTIHNCGCYHQFFPSARLTPRAPSPQREEAVFMPQSAPDLDTGERMTIGIDSNTHYLFFVGRSAGKTLPRQYRFADYDDLRSLPRADGSRRSLFGPRGIVSGSERGERFFFWPMGIESAGAMRQWGRHATAFVGRRHFDEPRLIERYFFAAEK